MISGYIPPQDIPKLICLVLHGGRLKIGMRVCNEKSIECFCATALCILMVTSSSLVSQVKTPAGS